MSERPDYYQILGVQCGATQEELAQAYRHQAMRCHPDRGGTHAAMCRLNEAWEILRDPVSRQAYDEFLAQQGAQSTKLSKAVERAKTAADQYPRRWVDFERWMDSFLNDFTKAEYGWESSGVWQFPTAKNSISGKLCILFGCLVGFFISGFVWLSFKGSPYYDAGRILVFIGTAVGGTAGMLVHLVIRSCVGVVRKSPPQKSAQPKASDRSIPPPIPPTTQHPAREIKFDCPHCSQHIEAPASLIGSIVSCPTCDQSIHIGNRAGNNQPPPIPQQPPPIP